eukprot:12346-Heterococcus_DN1.PRE.1
MMRPLTLYARSYARAHTGGAEACCTSSAVETCTDGTPLPCKIQAAVPASTPPTPAPTVGKQSTLCYKHTEPLLGVPLHVCVLALCIACLMNLSIADKGPAYVDTKGLCVGNILATRPTVSYADNYASFGSQCSVTVCCPST